MKTAQIIGVGCYLPKNIVKTQEIAERFGKNHESVEKSSGIRTRHYVSHETSSFMGAEALREALSHAGLRFENLDCVIGASGVPQQAIPSTASLIQEQFNASDTGIPCFDINSTCLSFVTAFDFGVMAIEAGRYDTIAIVSSEIASAGLNDKVLENAVLFGDGAAAIIIQNVDGEASKLIASHMQTFSEGVHDTRIRGGGTLIPPRKYADHPIDDFQFQMNGRQVFKLTLKKIDHFVNVFLDKGNTSMRDIALFVPHQASGASMKIMQRKLGIPEDRFMNIIENHGNMIAASIPTALYYAIIEGRIERGDKVMLIGTSAGLSIGGVIFEY